MNKKELKQITKQLNEVSTIEELETALSLKLVALEVSHRGGGLGFRGTDIEALLNLEIELPAKFGVYCNYLGGGLRGAICKSPYHDPKNEDQAETLEAILKACKRCYLNIENEIGLNEEEYEDGETNWDAMGTNKMRAQGVASAY